MFCGKPSISHFLFFNFTCIWIKKCLVFISGICIRRPLMKPVFHGHICNGKMIFAYMIIYCILDYFHAFCMNGIYKL